MAVKQESITATAKEEPVVGYLPADTPLGAMISLAFQQVLTMFPATVLVAILTSSMQGSPCWQAAWERSLPCSFPSRRIPMYYGSSFSYISVVITAMSYMQMTVLPIRPHSTVRMVCVSCRSASSAQPLWKS
jgi:uracil permease